MPRFKFTLDYDHRVRAGSVVAYKAGWQGGIPNAHAQAAKKAGAGNIIKEKPSESRKAKTPDPV